jgi:hypothetical protein
MLYVFDTQAPASTTAIWYFYDLFFCTTFLNYKTRLPCLRFGYNVHRTFTCDAKET